MVVGCRELVQAPSSADRDFVCFCVRGHGCFFLRTIRPENEGRTRTLTRVPDPVSASCPLSASVLLSSVAILSMDHLHAKFKRNFVAALHPVSPGLAAVHATRLRRERLPVLSPLHCARCGHVSVTTRIVAAQKPRSDSKTRRSSKRENKGVVAPSKRGLHRIKHCSSCGFTEATRLAVRDEANVNELMANTSYASITVDKRTGTVANVKDDRKDGESQTELDSESKAQATAKDTGPRPVQPIQPKSIPSSIRHPPVLLKKKGLQDMLARSKAKAKEGKEDNMNKGHGGLAVFLGGL